MKETQLPTSTTPRRRPTALAVEDDPVQLRLLGQALEGAGFTVIRAATASDALDHGRFRRGDLDVVVLDIKLGDKGKTGLDVGREIKQHRADGPPEFMVYSRYTEDDYVQTALQLGAAAYLRKNEATEEDVARVARVLALRCALETMQDPVGDIVSEAFERTTAPDPAELLAEYCRRVLQPRLEHHLGVTCGVLLTDPDGGTRWFATDASPVLPNDELARVHAVICGDLADRLHLLKSVPPGTRHLSGWVGAVCLPLSIRRFRLAVILMPSGSDAEKTRRLGETLRDYLEPVVVANALEILIKIAVKVAEVEARRDEIVTSSARICRFVGLWQAGLAQEVRALDRGAPCATRLTAFAEEMKLTADLFDSLRHRTEVRPAPRDAVAMNALVGSCWDSVQRWLDAPADLLALSGAATVAADEATVALIVERILQWQAQRAVQARLGRGALRCTITEVPDGVRVCFEDDTRRLPLPLRKRLFELNPAEYPERPGAPPERAGGLLMPLFTASLLASLRGGGRLEDRTDDRADELGHRFVLTLPSAE